MNITVLGAGSWGTALAVLLGRNGHQVRLLGRDDDGIEAMSRTRENSRYLPGTQIPNSVEIGLLDSCTEDSDFCLLAVPSGGCREAAASIKGSKPLVVIASKGLEGSTGKLLHEVVSEACPQAVVGALGGPNLAAEVVAGIPTATLAACNDEEAARKVCAALNCRTFRAYYSDDLIGVELAGALKNVLAIGAGASDGLGFGDNTKGALLARGLREMTLIGLASGAKIETFFGIAGVGDLFATAHSRLSRNYRVGYGIGKGSSLQEVLAEIGQVAEGVSAASCVCKLAEKYKVELPIMNTINMVLQGSLDPLSAVQQLMNKEPQRERIGIAPGTVLNSGE